MTLQDNITILNAFTHTEQDREKIRDFDFIGEKQKGEREKIKIEETFCTLVTVGGTFLEKKTFEKVLKKIDKIRKIIRVLLNNHRIHLDLQQK